MLTMYIKNNYIITYEHAIYSLKTYNWISKRIMSSPRNYNSTFESIVTVYNVQKLHFPSTSTAKQRHVSLYQTPRQDSSMHSHSPSTSIAIVNGKIFEHYFTWQRHSILSCAISFSGLLENEACFISFCNCFHFILMQ